VPPTTNTLIERPADLTAEWLTNAVGAGAVTDFSVDRIGTGQMSECYRVALTYADGDTGPASVVLKVAAADPSSRQTAWRWVCTSARSASTPTLRQG